MQVQMGIPLEYKWNVEILLEFEWKSYLLLEFNLPSGGGKISISETNDDCDSSDVAEDDLEDFVDGLLSISTTSTVSRGCEQKVHVKI